MSERIAISNIAWDRSEDDQVAPILSEHGVTGLEVALSKVSPDIMTVPHADAIMKLQLFKDYWEKHGIQIVAAQALLFGRPDLTLFDNPEIRLQTLRYLEKVIEFAAYLGAKVLVFGSPKNRRIGSMPLQQAESIAIDFFRRVGDFAQTHETQLLIEPTPVHYGADFLTHSDTTIDFILSVNHPAIRLIIDSAIMTMNGECVEVIVEESGDLVGHVHISEPDLVPIGTGGVDQAEFVRVMRSVNYPSYMSIEMKSGSGPDNVVAVRQALEYVADIL